MARDYPLKKIRNIGIIAHIDAGKTTVTETILYLTGRIHKIGAVHEGDTQMDWMEQERERGITITSAATTCFWPEKNKHKINIIDTPGHIDFTAEVQRSLRVLDGAVVIFDGKMGVEPQSETVWRQANEYDVPRICFINKINLLGGDFYKSLDSIHQRLSKQAFPICLPIGQGKETNGLVDLITQTAWVYDDEEGNKIKKADIPADMKEKIEKYRNEMLEKAAECDDELMEKFLEGKELKQQEIKQAIRKGTLQGKIFPVLGGDGRKAIVKILLDAIVDYLPAPIDVKSPVKVDDAQALAALAFKVASDPFVGQLVYVRLYAGTITKGDTILIANRKKKMNIGRIVRMHADHREEVEKLYAGDIAALVGADLKTGETICDPNKPILLEKIKFPEPVISLSIKPKTKADQEKMGIGLSRLANEDPTLQLKSDPDTGETILSGMGELHLEIILDRLKREFKVEAEKGKPQVAYKETITQATEVEGKYIRQSGGRGQYGHVWLKIEPWDEKEKKEMLKNEEADNERYVFINKIKGGVIPQEYIPAVDKGVKEALDKGVVAGYPLTNIKVTLYDGSYHEVDSSEAAFKVAASMALKKGASQAKPILLEPVMKLEVITPEKFLGDIIGDLGSKRANVEKIEDKERLKSVSAKVPLSEMFGYATQLRSISQGRASFVMEFYKYEPVPANVAEKIIGVEKNS